jgi:hypothetical protein
VVDSILTETEQLEMLHYLQRLTDTGTIEWSREDTAYRPDRRTANTPDGNFTFVLQSIDKDGERPYELRIYKGPRVSSRFFTVIQMAAADEGGVAEINSLIESLYAKAQKRQPSEEVVVKELFGTLKDLAPDNDDQQN